MARKAYTAFDLAGNERTVTEEMAGALATLASATNPDGSAYTLPVSGTVTATPSGTQVVSGTVNGSAATATAGAVDNADEALVAPTANLRLMGYSITESADVPAAATVNIRNGAADTDPLVAAEVLAASGDRHRWFGPNGIASADGVFIERAAGEAVVVVYTAVIA